MPSTTSAPSDTTPPSLFADLKASAGDGLRARIRDVARSIRDSLARELRRLSDTIGSPGPLIKALLDMIPKDREFGFYWLVAAIAISVALGLLVALVLSPVVAALAALIAAIWMLSRRRARSAPADQAA